MAAENSTPAHVRRSQPRAVLVTRNHDGSMRRTPVGREDSVLDVERDLLKHLGEMYVTDEWLVEVRNYCDGRLKARQDARERNVLIFPQAKSWDEQ